MSTNERSEHRSQFTIETNPLRFPIVETLEFRGNGQDFFLQIKDFGELAFRVTLRTGVVWDSTHDHVTHDVRTIVVFELRMVWIDGGQDGNGNEQDPVYCDRLELFNCEKFQQILKDQLWMNDENWKGQVGFNKMYDKLGVMMVGERMVGDIFIIGR